MIAAFAPVDSFSCFVSSFFTNQTVLDPKHNAGHVERDGSPLEFGGNTPSGGKFAVPWDMHGWTADPEHRGDSGFKTKDKSVYGGSKES